MWENLGSGVRVANGDCLKLLPTLPDGVVNMVLVDLPYGVVNRKSAGLRNLDKGAADVCEIDLDKVLTEIHRVCAHTVYIFCGTEQVSQLRGGLAERKWTTRLCIWEKTNPSPMNGQYFWLSSVECCVFGRRKGAVFNERCQSAVWRNPNGKHDLHPTQKPIALMERLIKASTNENDVVLDFTMGSGTTGVACVNLNRRFIGIEKDASYYEIAKKRIIEKLEECDCFAPLDCGYIHFWPASGGVAMSAAVLRFIADELDRRNADWDKQVQEMRTK